MTTVSVVSSRRSKVGEGPFWDQRINRLIYVDLLQGVISRLNPETQNEETVHLGSSAVSLVVPFASDPNQLIVSRDKQLYQLQWDTKHITLCAEVEPDANTRFNDGKCDSKGRLWAGTMGLETSPGVVDEGLGALYSMETNHSLVKHLSGISLSNGLTWSNDNKTMYYVDSFPRKIYIFHFDVETGSVSNQRTLIDFNKNSSYNEFGLPDGITIDAEDKLWVACYGASVIIRIDPISGNILRTIKLPAKRITSCCFGGPKYEDMYVTSAWYGLNEQEKLEQSFAGAVFKISNLGVKGLAPNLYAG